MTEPIAKLNWIDRVISHFDPAKGVERLKGRTILALSGANKGASYRRDATKTFNPGGGDADADLLDDLPTLRERTRDLARNAPIATGATNTKVTNVVGTGLRLQSAIDREILGLNDDQANAWEATTEREYRFWSESQECHAGRTLDFYGIQELAYRAALDSGDCLITMPFIERAGSPYSLKLQVIEADRIVNENNTADTATMAGGIERDSNGAPKRCWVLDRHPGSDRASLAGEGRWIDFFGEESGRRNVIHLYRMKRPGQSRGIPDQAPVIELLKQLDKYTDAEVDAAVKQALITFIITTETGEGLGGLNASEYVEQSNEFYKEKDVHLKSGTALQLFPDDKFEMPNTTRPNTAFDPFIVAILQQVGAALELPYEVLTKRFNSSFSASQAAMMEAWKFYKSTRQWLGKNLCAHVYAAWMDEAVARGRISAPGYFNDEAIRHAYLGAQWIGPPREHMNPVLQNKADREAEEMGWKSGAQNASERGNEWDKVNKRRAKEKAARIDDGLVDMENDDIDSENKGVSSNKVSAIMAHLRQHGKPETKELIARLDAVSNG
ncbi:MAG: phage portal protein [Gammaproteobacteria bacterium]|nr:phage portal protein [Gammaproteobacteria bacterium]